MGSTATTSPAERRVVFWFSWDGSIPSFMETLPEVDFQLNPWTLHHLLHGTNHASQREYEHSLVSCLFFLFIYFQLTSSFFWEAAMFFLLWMDYYPYLHFHEDGKNLCEGHCNVLEVMFKFYLF